MSFLLELSAKQPRSLRPMPRDREAWTSAPLAAELEFTNLIGIIRNAGRVWRKVRCLEGYEQQEQELSETVRDAIDLLRARLEAWQPISTDWN